MLSLKIITIFFVSVLSALAVMAVIGINLSIRQATQNLKETAAIALTSLSTTLSEDIDSFTPLVALRCAMSGWKPMNASN